MSDLTFSQLRKAGLERCQAIWPEELEWSPNDWFVMLVGEVGELGRDLRGLRRLGPTPETISDSSSVSSQWVLKNSREAIAKELADVICYADLLAHRLGIDLGEAVRNKFNEVSERVGSEEKL